MPNNGPVPKIKDTIYTQLFNRIMDSVYPRGVRLKEAELASEFNVSRTPIREVLQLLAQDGMIILHPHRGATVRPLTADDIEEIYEIRKSLEPLALGFSVPKLNLHRLKELRDQIISQSKETNLELLSAADFDLHAYIVDQSGKHRLSNMINQLYRLMQRFRYIGFHLPHVSQRVTQEHLDLLDALLVRDAETARHHLEEHIENSKKATLQFIFNKEIRDLP